MTIKSIQKVIKVGSSAGVTLPAKDLKHAGINVGDEVEITLKPSPATSAKVNVTLDDEYEAFKARYGDTLKNLSQR